MAIYWGPYQNHVRVGIEMNPSVGTSSVTMGLAVWAQTDSSSSMYINGTVVRSGTWGGSTGVSLSMGPNQTQRLYATTGVYNRGSSNYDVSFGARVDHYFGSSYFSKNYTITAKPAPTQPPNPPSNLSVTRVSEVGS